MEKEQKSSYVSRFRRLDGTYFWAAGIIEKMLDEEGEPILIATFHDITSEKLAQEEDPGNIILMHAAGANVSGQIASVVAGGLVISLVTNLL